MSNDDELYRTDIPDGVALWYRPEELPPRRKREVDVAGTMYAPALARAIEGMTVDPDAKKPGENPDADASESDDLDIEKMSQKQQISLVGGLAQTEADTRQLFAMNELNAWAYLKSWTLTIDGTPKPLPATPDEILDLPRDLYDALLDAAAKISAAAQRKSNGFTVDSVENPNSPIGGSEG